MAVAKKPKRDALDALLEKQTQIKIAGLDFKFRFASATERVKWLSEFPRGDEDADPVEQSSKVQEIIGEVLSALHIVTPGTRKRTADEWVSLMTFAEANMESDFGDFNTLTDYGLALMGVANRQDPSVADQVGANPT